MLHITFNSIKAKDACEPGYDRLAAALGGDAEYGMDKPISLIDCIETNTLEDVIWALRATLEDSRAISVAFARKCADSVKHLKNARAGAGAANAAGAYYAAYVGVGAYDAADAAADAADAAASAAYYARAADYAAHAAAGGEAAKQKGFLIELLTKGE